MQAFSVSAVVSFLREVLEANEIFSDLWIAGEVASFNRSQLGHRYFSLRDPGAALKSVLFRDSMPGLALKDGDRVLAHGRLTIYTQRGDLQFVCDFVRPEGVGLLAARFEELRQRLELEGLFAAERKRPLPPFPGKIGVVTSPAGAALQDIKNVLARRWPAAQLVLAAAMVQGPEAPAEIAGALRALSREPDLDLIILARGGGSAEDLSPFNAEAVARAIFASRVPVVAGVGHETDETIADYVADLRAPTPSAAAERATPEAATVYHRIDVMDRAIAAAATRELAQRVSRCEQLAGRLERAAPHPPELRREVDARMSALAARAEGLLSARRASLDRVSGRLSAMSPAATLARGFAIVQDAKSRRVVTSVRKVRAGQRLNIGVADGAFWTEVS